MFLPVFLYETIVISILFINFAVCLETLCKGSKWLHIN